MEASGKKTQNFKSQGHESERGTTREVEGERKEGQRRGYKRE
jgi:hypothetical protein